MRKAMATTVTESPQALRARLDFDDARLLAECEVHAHRTGGPGGQHRNKVETAIRLVHRPSGLVVTAGETRSQHENKARALHRLREAIAVHVRLPAPAVIVWPASVHIRDGRVRVNESNPSYYQALALMLDVFAGEGAKLADAGARLGVSSSSLTRFFADTPRAWDEACRIRRAAGLSALKA